MKKLYKRIRSLICIMLVCLLALGNPISYTSASGLSYQMEDTLGLLIADAQEPVSDESAGSGLDGEGGAAAGRPGAEKSETDLVDETETDKEQESVPEIQVDPESDLESESDTVKASLKADGASVETGQEDTPDMAGSLDSMVSKTNTAAGRDVSDKISELSVTIIDTKNGNQDIGAGGVVSMDAVLDVNFLIAFDSGPHLVFQSGDHALITMPAELSFDPLETGVFDIKDSDGNVVAQLTITGQIMKIVFQDNVIDADEITIKFHISARFHKELLEEGGERELVFEVNGEGVASINVDFEEVDMVIVKTFSEVYEQEGAYYQKWLLNVNAKGKELRNTKVTDTLPEGVSYDSHRFTDSDGSGWERSVENNGQTIFFEHLGTLRDSVGIEVVTKVTDFTKLDVTMNTMTQNISTYNIKNKAEMTAIDKSGVSIGPVEDAAEVKFLPEWVVKNGTVSISEKAIHWELEVNREYASLYNAKVVDIVPEGLTVDQSGITVTKIQSDGTQTTEHVRSTVSSNSDGTSTLVITLGDITDYFIITYSTGVREDFFENQGEARFTNLAYMTWTDRDGNSYRSVEYKKTITAVNNWIEKKGWWWPARKYTEWFITINPNQYELAGEVVIVDQLSVETINSELFYQVFNADKDNSSYGNKPWIKVSAIDENGDPTGEYLEQGIHYNIGISDNGQTLTATFKEGVLNEKAVVLYVESEVPDEVNPVTLASSGSFSYDNTVSMSVNNNELASVTGQVGISRSISSKSVRKGHTLKDIRAHWQLTANPYKLEGIGSLTIRDVLPEFLVLDTYDGQPGSDIYIEVYEANTKQNGDPSNFTYYKGNKDDSLSEGKKVSEDQYSFVMAEDGTTFTITFDEQVINGSAYYIYFYSRVTEDFFAEPRSKVAFQNKSYGSVSILPGKEFGIFSSTTQLSNDPLKKTVYTSQTGNGVISWDIWINNSEVDVDLDGVTLVDELQDGLVLDITSVKLEKKTSANSYVGVDFDPNECIKYDYHTNIFEFTLPSGLDREAAYVLNFSTDVLKSGYYSNSVTMKGFANGETTASVIYDKYMSVTDYDGSATTSNKQRITLTKTDEYGVGLEGAVFELRTADGILLETATSGADGKVNFQSLLSRKNDYRIYEIEVPRGYQMSEEPYITVNIETALNYTSVNKQIYVPVELKKVDEGGSGLAGAEFSVIPFYWETDGEGRKPVAEFPLTGQFVSDEEGKINLGSLPYGLYAVIEDKAPAGYMLPESFLAVEITSPPDGSDQPYQVIYWDVVENRDGSYSYEQRTLADYGDRLKEVTNYQQTYKFTVYKIDSESHKPLEGADFEIYEYDKATLTAGTKIDTYTTDRYGRIEVHLPEGYYLVKEVKAPWGYALDTGAEKVIYLSADGAEAADRSVSVSGAGSRLSEFQWTVENKKLTTDIWFQKVDAAEKKVLKEAKFNLYEIETDENGIGLYIPTEDEVSKVIVSDADGKLKLDELGVGIYVLQEAVAPEGYIRSMDGYIIEITLGDSGQLVESYYKVEGGRENFEIEGWRTRYKDSTIQDVMSNGGGYQITNEKDIVLYDFTIYKRDAESGVPLAGAVFEIWTTKDGENKNEQITDANGMAQYVTDFSGEINVQLQEGKYLLIEVEAPVGYVFDNIGIPFMVDKSSAANSIIVMNTPQTVSVVFTKVDENGEGLSGSTFNLYQFYPEELDAGGFPIYDGTGVLEDFHFRLDQQIISEPNINLELEHGWYALQEVAAPEDYARSLDMWVIHVFVGAAPYSTDGNLIYELYYIEGGMAGWNSAEKIHLPTAADMEIPNEKILEDGNPDADLSDLTILKKGDNGEVLPNVTFYVASKDPESGIYTFVYKDGKRVELTTNSLGIATYGESLGLTEGVYYLYEKSDTIPDGYLPPDELTEITLLDGQETYVEIINKSVKAEVTFLKQNRYDKPVEGAVFNLYKVSAATQQEIVDADNPHDYIHFHKNVTSDENGFINLEELPFGIYLLQESVAAPGYVRDLDVIIGIEITTAGELHYYSIDRSTLEVTPLEEDYDRVIYNDLSGYNVRILKQDEDTSVPLPGAEFKIYLLDENSQKEEMVLVKGVTPEGTYITDTRGEINILLPAGTYKLVEISTPYGYEAIEDNLQFVVDGSSAEKVVQVYNKRILKDLQFLKVSDEGLPLSGATFNLYELDVDDSQDKLELLGSQFLRTIQSGGTDAESLEDGVLLLKDLSQGWYVIQEAVAPEGYYRSLDALVIHMISPDTIVYYDVFGGFANAQHYQLREVGTNADGSSKDILIRNESMNTNDLQLELYKFHRIQSVSTVLPNARFKIYQIMEGREVQITTGADLDGLYTTDVYGKVTVNLHPGAYRIDEVEAPDGFEIGEQFSYKLIISEIDGQLFVETDGGTVQTESISIEIENKATGKVQVQKYDEAGEPLGGARFDLYRVSESNGQPVKIGEYGEDNDIDIGLITIGNLRIGNYILIETAAPDGYKLSEQQYTFSITKGGAEPELVKVTNEKIPLVTAVVKKVDTNGIGLAGAEFRITPFEIVNGAPKAGESLAGSYVSGRNGLLELKDLTPGYYAIEETKTPVGYMASDSFLVIYISDEESEDDIFYWDVKKIDGQYTYEQRDASLGDVLTHIVNEEQTYKLSIYKTDDIHGSHQPLSGAGFKIYTYDYDRQIRGGQIENPLNEDGIYYTDDEGLAEIDLPIGDYEVVEVIPPRGYLLSDPASQIVRLTRNMRFDAAETLVFRNEQLTDAVVFKKTDAEGRDLPGAEFNLYLVREDENGQLDIPTRDEIQAVITSDSNGEIRLEGLTEGIYALQERTAPDGYVRSLDIYAVEVTLSADETTLEKSYYYVEGGMTGLSVENWRAKYQADGIAESMKNYGKYAIVNESVSHAVTIYKRDADDRDLPLPDVVFEIYDADGVRVTDGADPDGRFVTAFDGTINISLKAGTYTLKEVQWPAGYEMPDKMTITVEKGKREQSFALYNKQKTVDIFFTKVDKDDHDLMIEGALFNLYGFNTLVNENGEDIFDERTKPWIIDQVVSNANGLLEINGLTTGWYALQEADAPDGYKRSLEIIVIHVFEESKDKPLGFQMYSIKDGFANMENYIETDEAVFFNEKVADVALTGELGILKLDGNGHLLAGVKFEVIDSNGKVVTTLVTDQLGVAACQLDPGSYTLKEVEGLDGYVFDPQERSFNIIEGEDTYIEIINEEIIIAADVKFRKTDRSGHSLKGAQFQLYTLQHETLTYYETAVSDDQGYVVFNQLSVGFYVMAETKAPDGYIRNRQAFIGIQVIDENTVRYYEVDPADYSYKELTDDADFVLIPDDSDEDVAFAFMNSPLEYAVRIIKTDALTNVALTGAAFKLYEKSDYYTPEGGINPERKALEEGSVDSDGEWCLNLLAGTYVLEEVRAPYGYESGGPVELLIEDKDSEYTIVVENQQITVDLAFSKVTQSGEPLAGAEFNLYQADVEETDDGPKYVSHQHLKTIASNWHGNLNISALPYGWYAIQEAVAPDGYIRSLDILAFRIYPDEAGETRVTYYDVYGGIANIDDYVLRDDEEKILLRNETEKEERQTLTIRKVRGSDGTGLPGAKFRIDQIMDADGTTVQITTGAGPDGSYTTNTLGHLDLLLFAGRYRIEEVEAPAGYQLPEDTVTELEIADENVLLTVVNDLLPVKEICLIKSAEDTGEALGGAEFKLSEVQMKQAMSGRYEWDETVKPQPVADLKSDDEGRVLIGDLAEGWYLLQETKAPVGYITSNDLVLIHVFVAGDVLDYVLYDVRGGLENINAYQIREDGDYTIINEPVIEAELGTLVICKQSDTGELLKDAVFGLFLDEQCHEAVVEESTGENVILMTDGLGYASVSLREGNYYLKEIEAPKGYLLNEGVAAVVITAGTTTTVDQQIVNKAVSGIVEFVKQNADGDALEGAKFDLYKVAASYAEDQEIVIDIKADGYAVHYGTAVSAKDGKVRFTLPHGVYAIVESEAPSGYVCSNAIIGIEITTEGTVNYYAVDAEDYSQFVLLDESYDRVIVNEKESAVDPREEPEEEDSEDDSEEDSEPETKNEGDNGTETESSAESQKTTEKDSGNTADKSDNDQDQKRTNAVKTDDNTVIIWSIFTFVGSMTLIVYSIKRRRKSKN